MEMSDGQSGLLELPLHRADSGSWVMSHGSDGSTNLDGSRWSWVSTCNPLAQDPLTDDKSIKFREQFQ